MQSRKCNRAARSRRRGVLSLELALSLPVLLVLLLGMLEFSLLLFARADVAEACRAGARTASLRAATEQEVEEIVRQVLSPRLHAGLEVHADLGSESGSLATVIVRTPMTAAAPDLLWPVGFGLQGRYLHCETRMVKE